MDIGGMTVGRDDRNQEHGALVLRLDRFIRELRLRAIETCGATIAAGSGVRGAAPGVESFARAKTAAIAVADACSVSLTKRIALENRGQWITVILGSNIRHIDRRVA